MDTIQQTTPDLPANWDTKNNDRLARYCQREGCGQTKKRCKSCGWIGCPYCKSSPCCNNPRLKLPSQPIRDEQKKSRMAQWSGGRTIGEVEAEQMNESTENVERS